MVLVRSFGNRIEAELAKGALEAAGIDAMIQADSVGDQEPYVAFTRGGYRLLVREEDEKEAREILA